MYFKIFISKSWVKRSGSSRRRLVYCLLKNGSRWVLVVLRGLQNRCGGLGTSQVGSIPTYSRQKHLCFAQRCFSYSEPIFQLFFQVPAVLTQCKESGQIPSLSCNLLQQLQRIALFRKPIGCDDALPAGRHGFRKIPAEFLRGCFL